MAWTYTSVLKNSAFNVLSFIQPSLVHEITSSSVKKNPLTLEINC